MMGAARGVWAGVLGSLLLISPHDADADPEAPAVPLEAAELEGRVGLVRRVVIFRVVGACFIFSPHKGKERRRERRKEKRVC